MANANNPSAERCPRCAAFTLIEVLVVVAIIALLVAILLPSLSRARELSRRVVCVNDLHMLAVAWTFYHTDNKGALVYAATTWAPNPSDPTDWYKTQPPGWVRFVVSHPYDPWNASDAEQLKAIRDGALYKYARLTDIYRCPSLPKNEIRTFGSQPGVGGSRPGSREFAAKIGDIVRPQGRIVYIDTEPDDWDALWVIHYDRACWWNQIVPRHGPGQTVGFADGHAEWWRWLDARTNPYMSNTWQWCEDHIYSNPADNNPDKRRLQLGCYGKLGYTPP